MSKADAVKVAELGRVFKTEVLATGGEVTDVFSHERLLLMRSTLPWAHEVRPRDIIKGGVAMKATNSEIWLHPYILRLVCRNGAIISTPARSRLIAELESLTPEEAASALRGAIRACCDRRAFASDAQILRGRTDVVVDLAFSVERVYQAVGEQFGHRVATRIAKQFEKVRDRSVFGLGNIVTSVARMTSDPRLRWRLEEFGGGILLGDYPTTVSDPTAAVSPTEA